MKLHLSNLDELVQRVRNNHPKNYLNEAIVSYRAGAYRASIIATWIAVCVDIIEKVKELSATGDVTAKAIELRLNKIKPSDPSSMLAFENEVLDIACNQLELISVIEQMHLERLKQDRNICAHPTFSIDGNQFNPLAETALSYIVQSANYLLIQRPVKGKVVVERLYELIHEESFPEDDEKAYVVLSSDNNLGRVKDSSVRNLTIILLKRIFRDEEKIPLNNSKKLLSSLNSISRLYSDIYNEVLSDKLSPMLSGASDKLLKRAYPFLERRHEAWSVIEEDIKVRMEGLLSSMSVEEVINYRVVELSENHPKIQTAFISIFKTFKVPQKTKLMSALTSSIFKEEAIDLFCHSMSYDTAEYRGNNLIAPLSALFTIEEVKQILDGACNNQGSHGYNQILNAGSIESFFIQFYKITMEKGPSNSDNWISFRNSIKKLGVTYSSLDESLSSDGYIEAEPEETVTEFDEIPL